MVMSLEGGVDLVECTGSLSWDRYQRMQQAREYNDNAAEDSPAHSPNDMAPELKSRIADSGFWLENFTSLGSCDPLRGDVDLLHD